MVSVVKVLCTLGRIKLLLYMCSCPSVNLASDQCFVFLRRLTAIHQKKGMADHAGAFRDAAATQFHRITVTHCYFHVFKIVRDKATLFGSFYPAVMATVQELVNLPSPEVHRDKKEEAMTDWVSQAFGKSSLRASGRSIWAHHGASPRCAPATEPETIIKEG